MKDPKQGLRNLTDALVDDIMETSDADILAEMLEDGEDPQVVLEHMQVLLDRAIKQAATQMET